MNQYISLASSVEACRTWRTWLEARIAQIDQPDNKELETIALALVKHLEPRYMRAIVSAVTENVEMKGWCKEHLVHVNEAIESKEAFNTSMANFHLEQFVSRKQT